MPEQAIHYLMDWSQVLPHFCWGGITADDRENIFFFEELKLEPLSECFGSFLGWFHLISPRGFEPYFRANDLLHLPAEKSRPWKMGPLPSPLTEIPLLMQTPSQPRELEKSPIISTNIAVINCPLEGT